MTITLDILTKTYSTKANAIRAAKAANLADYEVLQSKDSGRFSVALSNQEEEEVEKAEAGDFSRESTIPTPTKMVFIIADRMVAEAVAAGQPAPRRKDVIKACEDAGVAHNTARTQYQHWYSIVAKKN